MHIQADQTSVLETFQRAYIHEAAYPIFFHNNK